jgi:hypothetical protein
MRKLTAAMTFALLTTAGGAGAAEIKALISTAVADAMAELVPQFERASGHTLRITYGPTGYVFPERRPPCSGLSRASQRQTSLKTVKRACSPTSTIFEARKTSW